MRASAVSVERGRRAVVLAGIALGLVLVLGLLHWRDLLARYHLIRLRADPARLRAAVLEPEGSLSRAGLSFYLETEEGKDRLARAYLAACDSLDPLDSRGVGEEDGHLPGKGPPLRSEDGGPGDVRRDPEAASYDTTSDQ